MNAAAARLPQEQRDAFYAHLRDVKRERDARPRYDTPAALALVATRYEVRGVDTHPLLPVAIEQRRPGTWAVVQGGNTLGRDPDGYFWELEPMPSSRDDRYMAEHRYPSLSHAVAAVHEAIRLGVIPWKAPAPTP